MGEREVALTPWVVHDLRRSMATHMERLGIAPHIIEVCLGHTLKGIGATYRHYSYLAEKTAALQVWADELAPEPAQDTFKCDSSEENVRDEEAA